MRFLLLNQTFHPDVVASGQYLTDVALALVRHGHQVTVVTSLRAYDSPGVEFAEEEFWEGINIIRVGSTGFGKAAKWRRCVDFLSFIGLCAFQLSGAPKPDVVMALTSPPLIALLAACLAKWHGIHFIYWVMDLNPDEAIAAGWLKANSLVAKVFERLSRLCLYSADKIIALDPFMQDRILAKGVSPGKVVVVPLWSRGIHFDAVGRKGFRALHGLEQKFVVMYSGNHSPCHPLDSLLKAAARLAHDPGIVFCFVGGGSEFRKLQQLQKTSLPPNILCLCYQPLAELSASLSAADLHVVIMGDELVGLVHPCKVYNLLSLGSAILYIGPERSPVAHLLAGAAQVVAAAQAGPYAGGGAIANAQSKPLKFQAKHARPLYAQAQHGAVETITQHICHARQHWSRIEANRGLSTNSRLSRETVLPKLLAQVESFSRLK